MPSRERAPMPRRALLAGLAASPAAIAIAVAAVPATAHPAPSAPRAAVLAEVAELTQLYDAAMKRSAAAVEACDAAEERYIHPRVPEALFLRSEDPLSYAIHAERTGDRFWYGSQERIDTLRGWPVPASAATSSPIWQERYARRSEVLAAYDQWQADIEAAQDAAGLTAAEAEFKSATEEAEKPVRQRILELRSTDPAVLRLKVRAYLDTLTRTCWQDALDHEIDRAIARENGAWSDAMALSILRDLVTAYRQADA